MVRNVPSSFVGMGELSFWERCSARNIIAFSVQCLLTRRYVSQRVWAPTLPTPRQRLHLPRDDRMPERAPIGRSGLSNVVFSPSDALNL
jgi:hypothetical protein